MQRDQDDMVEFVRNTPPEFKEYYIQMQVAKRSQAPLPSQVNIILTPFSFLFGLLLFLSLISIYFCMNYNQLILIVKVSDDRVILDRTVGDQVSSWKKSRGFTDEAVTGHVCSGRTCSYTKIGDVFLCEKTGRVHGRNSPFIMMLIDILLQDV